MYVCYGSSLGELSGGSLKTKFYLPNRSYDTLNECVCIGQDEESLDPLDPHSALAAISLEDLQTPPK